MYKFLLLLFFSIACSYSYGQTDSLSKEDLRLLDSMFKNDEFMKMMMDNNNSYLDINTGIGNGIFSQKNNSLNTGQAITNKIYYTTSVGYFHKSGLSLSLSGFLATDSGKLKFYQYAITPSYVYNKKKIIAGISYTRLIKGSGLSFEANPYKNDFYAYLNYKKTWIEPGLAAGYSFGKNVEYYDTSFWLLNRIVHIRDTITTRISGLSVTLSATHKWNFYELLNKKDAIKIQPSLLLNMGSQSWKVSHSNSLINRRPIVQNFLKRRYGDGSTAAEFKIQSMAFSFGVTYYYGKFYLQPQVYLDYYLPSTTDNRLTSLYSVVAGFAFY